MFLIYASILVQTSFRAMVLSVHSEQSKSGSVTSAGHLMSTQLLIILQFVQLE